jgi:hypothetical protein
MVLSIARREAYSMPVAPGSKSGPCAAPRLANLPHMRVAQRPEDMRWNTPSLPQIKPDASYSFSSSSNDAGIVSAILLYPS